MCRFFRLENLLLFAITFAASVLINQSFDYNFSGKKVFSKTEASALLNKRIKSLCNAKFVRVEQTDGKTASISKDFKGGYSVAVNWSFSIRGKNEIIHYDKENYQKCIIEVGEAED